jgi:hypothetical protein
MSNNEFGNLTSDGMEETRDTIGGYTVHKTDVYDADIKLAYSGKSATSAARSLTVHFTVGGAEFRETFWVTNKNNENFSVKDGKKIPILGYVTADELCLMSTGSPLAAQTMEEKVIQLYYYDQKREVPTNAKVMTSIMGLKVKLAINHVKEFKTKKNPQTGEYEPIAETREYNSVQKVFHYDTNKTVNEFREGKEPTFMEEWIKVKKHKINDKTKGADAPPGGGASGGRAVRPDASGSGSKPTGSLFNKP